MREALKLALEALTYCEALNRDVERQKTQAITAIKEALAQPEQEEDWDAMGQKILAATARDTKRTWEDAAVKAVNKIMQEEQEPVAYLCENAVGHKYFRWKKPSSTYKPIALYTTPPKREWVGLTSEELSEFDVDPIEAKLMIAKLKEKNT